MPAPTGTDAPYVACNTCEGLCDSRTFWCPNGDVETTFYIDATSTNKWRAGTQKMELTKDNGKTPPTEFNLAPKFPDYGYKNGDNKVNHVMKCPTGATACPLSCCPVDTGTAAWTCKDALKVPTKGRYSCDNTCGC